MPGKTTRSSNLELLRILCMLLIIGDHLTGQSGIADYTTLPSSFAFCLIGCGSRIACSVFVLIGGWFLCEQPYKTRRPLSLWLSLWLYTVPVTLLCKLAGLDVSWGALRWAAFPASTRQLWFISDYLLLLLCVPLLNRLLRGLSRPAHRGLLAVLAVPLIVYPTLFGENGQAPNCVLADGCHLFGCADSCVIFREVDIEEGADVRDSIIMQGSHIGAHAKLRYVILDKNVTIKPGTQLLGSPDHPLVINKGAVI